MQSPVQLTPSPMYPNLQEQLYEPCVLTQAALASHLCFPVAHSSTSKRSEVCNYFLGITVVVDFYVTVWVD